MDWRLHLCVLLWTSQWICSKKMRVERTTARSSPSTMVDLDPKQDLFFDKNIPCLYTLKVPSFLPTLSACNATCQKKERTSLMSFYYSTAGERWRYQGHWGNTSVHHCQWYGITCCNRTKHVLAINLARHKLSGDLGDALRGIQYLLGLCIGRNEIKGNLFSIYSSLSPHIMRVDLAYNDVEGSFHLSGVTKKRNLQKIQLSGSKRVDGRIPDDIGQLKNLVVLSLGETNIRGHIPHSITDLADLQFLDFETLHLTGSLESFRYMKKLQYMHLAANRIVGKMATNFGLLYPGLVELHLQNNYIYDEIPSSIGDCLGLEQFHVGGNIHLGGHVPKSIGLLRHLKIFSISGTSIKGFEPGFEIASPKLGLFGVSNLRKFKANMPELIKILRKANQTLMQLDAHSSQIYGTLDDTIFSFSYLTLLNLRNNQLSGVLPDPKNNVEFLSNVDLRFNNFSGSLPISFTRLQMLQQLDLRNNVFLKGSIEPTFLLADFGKLSKPHPSSNFVCPEIRFVHNKGAVLISPEYYDSKHCLCSFDNYGLGGHCKSCLKGATCPGVTAFNRKWFNATEPIPLNASCDTQMRLKYDYWPFPSHQNVETLIKCPFTYNDNVCNNDGNCSCRLQRQGKSSDSFVTSCKESCLCRIGHHGRFCSQCKSGYFKESNLCYKCPQGASQAIYIAGIVGVCILVCIVTVVVYIIGKKWLKVSAVIVAIELLSLLACVVAKKLPMWPLQFAAVLSFLVFGAYVKSCQGITKSVIFYFQVVGSLVSFHDAWLLPFYQVQSRISNAFNLQFSSLACFMTILQDQVARHALLYSLPLLFTLLLIFYYLGRSFVYKCRKMDDDNKREVKYTCLRYCMLFLDFTFFPITKSAFKIVVRCKTVQSLSATVSYMPFYVWINCSCSSFVALRVLAILALFIYTFGIPYMLFTALLFKYREKIKEEDPDVRKWLGCLYNAFKDDFRLFMEIVLITKRLLIAIGLSLLPVEESIQTIVLVLLLLIFLVFDCYTQPFKAMKPPPKCFGKLGKIGLENLLSSFTSLVLIMSIVFVRAESVLASKTSYWVTVCLNFLLLISYAVAIIFNLIPSKEEQGQNQDQEQGQRQEERDGERERLNEDARA